MTSVKLVEFAISGESIAVVSLTENTETLGIELARFVVQGDEYGVFSTVAAQETPAPSPAQVLTSRELQITMLVAEGLVSKEIAGRLHISEWTVCTHVRRIYSKLGVSTRGAMVSRITSSRPPK